MSESIDQFARNYCEPQAEWGREDSNLCRVSLAQPCALTANRGRLHHAGSRLRRGIPALLAVLACLTGWTLSERGSHEVRNNSGGGRARAVAVPGARTAPRSLSVSLAVPPQTWPRTWTRRPKAAQHRRDQT